MLQVVKVRLYPTEQQKVELTKNFGAVRKVWNYYLAQSNKDYLETKKGFNCGTHHDRDENAAKNIREEGLRILAAGTTATALGDSVRPSRSNSRRRGSANRESPATAAIAV